ncbi:TPR repeat region-containing protein [Nocardia sp. NPDC004722]
MITDDTMIGTTRWKDLDDKKKSEIKSMLFDLTDGAQKAQSADDKLREELKKQGTSNLSAFTSAAALSGEQARSDAAELASGHQTPDEIARMVAAGHLPPEQLAGLESGGTATVPASQMQYLTEIARALDGKSPEEIASITSKLPPDARQAFANGMQILASQRVDGGSAGKGGFDRLPQQWRNSLSRPDLVQQGWEGVPPMPEIKLNGVADNQAIATVVGAGDDHYKLGSDLDRKLIDVGRQYLHGQVLHEQNPDSKFECFTVDGHGTQDRALTEGIFQAVGADKFAVESVITDKDHGKEFTLDLLSHQWSDHDRAVSSLFRFGDSDAIVADPNNAVEVARATRMGHIMSAFAQNVGNEDAWNALSNVPGHGSNSAGQLNPELMRTVSHSLAPYVSDLVRDGSPLRPGFETNWIGKQNFANSAFVAALLNTDGQAGTVFNKAVMDTVLNQEVGFADHLGDPNAGQSLLSAGRLQGVLDKGLMLETGDQYRDAFDAQKETYDRKVAAFEGATAAIKLAGGLAPGPTGALVSFPLDAFGTSLKDGICGPQPEMGKTPVLQGVDEYRQLHSILEARQTMHGLPSTLTAAPEFGYAFDANGRLKSYDAITDINSSYDDGLRVMLSRIGGGEGRQIMDGYRQVTLKDG